MPFENFILDGVGGNYKARVTDQNAVLVEIAPSTTTPTVGTENTQRLMHGRLGTLGLDSGSTDMVVNGSVTPVNFYVKSVIGYDILINSIVMVISATTISNSKFGNLTALGNGIDIVLSEGGGNTIIIEGGKTGGQVISESGGKDNDNYVLPQWQGNNDAQFIIFPMGINVPNGLRIGRGTADNLRVTINDNLTGLDDMFVQVFGNKHYP